MKERFEKPMYQDKQKNTQLLGKSYLKYDFNEEKLIQLSNLIEMILSSLNTDILEKPDGNSYEKTKEILSEIDFIVSEYTTNYGNNSNLGNYLNDIIINKSLLEIAVEIIGGLPSKLRIAIKKFIIKQYNSSVGNQLPEGFAGIRG